MRTTAILLLSFWFGGVTHPAAAVQRGAAPAARGGIAMTVTEPGGARLAGVDVEMLGLTDRRGETDENGQINFPALQAGTYRLRFSGEAVIAFEREVTLRANQVTTLDITLNRPEIGPVDAQPEPEPEAAAAMAWGPPGQPLAFSVVDLVEREQLRGGQPRRDTLLSCSGNTRTLLVQLNEPQTERVYDTAESVYYVIAGEGTATLGAQEARLAAGSYLSVPRGTMHSLTRMGRRPLILLAMLSGAPCDEVR